jgi:hypothetical protein
MLLFPGLAVAGPMEQSAPSLSLGSSFLGSEFDAQDGYNYTNQFNLRLGSPSLLLSLDNDTQAPPLSAGTSSIAPDAVVDFYPFQSIFRLSGGFLYDPDPFESPTATGNQQIMLGGLPFTPSRGGAAPGALDFNAYTPYAGLGVQSAFWSGRLQFALDFGLQFDREANSDDGGNGPAVANGDDSEAAQEDIELLGFSPRAGVSV